MAMVEGDQELGFDTAYSLKAAFTRESGRIFLTGIDALVRLPLMQNAWMNKPASIPPVLSPVIAGRLWAAMTRRCGATKTARRAGYPL